MTNCFMAIDENACTQFQTKPLAQSARPLRDLWRVVAIIAACFVPRDTWVVRRNVGSATLQDTESPFEAITVFFDHNGELAQRVGLALSDERIVVAIELTHQPPGLRYLIREALGSLFSQLYCDPTKGYSKYRLNPSPPSNHSFDILFLGDGPCPFSVSERSIAAIASRLMDMLTKDGAEIPISGLRQCGEEGV